MSIAIVDYGVANLGSMLNMLRKIGSDPQLAATAEEVRRADKLILPGIGAFDQGMRALGERGLIECLRERVVDHKVPLLGVCLGMQLLGESSEEGSLPGLGLFHAKCARLTPDETAGIRVPHMGWNHLQPLASSPLLLGLNARARFYFVHSYHMVCVDPTDVLATARYGIDFTAMIQRGNLFGAQFHPEKSHGFGMQMLRNFVDI